MTTKTPVTCADGKAHSAWYEVDEIPKLGTGKVDLRGLNELARKVAASGERNQAQ